MARLIALRQSGAAVEGPDTVDTRRFWVPPAQPGWAAFLDRVGADPADATTKLVFADWLDEQDRPVDATLWRRFVDLVPLCADRQSHPSLHPYGIDRWHWFTSPGPGIGRPAIIDLSTFTLTYDVMADENKPLQPHRTAARAYLSLVAWIMTEHEAGAALASAIRLQS